MKSANHIRLALLLIGVSGITALSLAWVSNGFTGLTGWLSFLVLILLAAGLGAGLFRLLRAEAPPAWLARLTLGAAALRVAAGVAWFVLLPAIGYDTDVQNAGYVMEDAFRRDQAAWELASSDVPLSGAFRETELGNLRGADQYGGYLFLSALVYRTLGAGAHHPLLIVVLSAALSALAVPLGWAAARRISGDTAAVWAAWGLALYSEAVLLGSSQMREGLVMPLAAAAVYGLVLSNRQAGGRLRSGLGWIVVPLLLLLPISPPYAGILVALLALTGLGLDGFRILRSWRLWLVLGGLALLAAAALTLGWEQIAPRLDADQYASPLEMAASWFELSARWQAHQTEDASGWLQQIFESTPEWFHLPFLVLYGVARPLLPAQLAAFSIPIWWAIGVWRALGWTALLILLLAAPVQMLRSPDRGGTRWGLLAAAWAAVLVASFWGGGDMWDNPRYRVAFIAIQVVTAAGVIADWREKPDPLLRRLALAGLAVPAWFLFWYLRRYTAFDLVFGWTVVDLLKVLGAGILTGVLLAVWDWAKT